MLNINSIRMLEVFKKKEIKREVNCMFKKGDVVMVIGTKSVFNSLAGALSV